jgi:hypothetical protein
MALWISYCVETFGIIICHLRAYRIKYEGRVVAIFGICRLHHYLIVMNSSERSFRLDLV